MAKDQLSFIRGKHGIEVNTVEIHEKDFMDKVLIIVSFLYHSFI